MDTTYNSNSGDTNAEVTSIYDYINNILINPSIIIILVVVVLIYLGLFMYLGGSSNTDTSSSSNTSDASSGGSKIIIVIMVGVFIVLAIINGLQYFLGVDIIANIQNIFSGEPEIDIAVNTTQYNAPTVVPEIKLSKQVFNIPGNTYVYPDAKALCTAYGAELATYKQVEDSYTKGGEWCNYGWSDGQLALFPTQQATYDGLQQIKGHENDCGRPGVNGGYMANPALKFGVNCYGYKPQMTPEEEDIMQQTPHYPQTAKDLAMERRVNYWKDNLTDVLVSPFNYDNWSKI